MICSAAARKAFGVHALALAMTCAFSGERSFAQNDSIGQAAVSDVVITGSEPGGSSLTSPDAEGAMEKLHSFPGATDIVDAANMKRGRGSYLEDLLPYQPGLLVQSAQGSEDTKVSIRGSGIQNDDISGLTLLIDGIPLNQADGEAFLHDIDLQSVKYAEVYRGADALRYGAVSLGGAINLVTVTGHEADIFRARLSFGSFGFSEQQITSGWSDGPWDIYGSFVDHVLDGFRAHSEENFQKVFVSAGYRLNEYAENRFYFFYGRLEQNNPSGLTKEELSFDPRQTDPQSIREKWSTYWNYERLMDQFVIQRDDAQLRLSLSWNHRQETHRQEFEQDFRLGATRSYSDDFAADLAFETKADLLNGRNRFSMGVIPTFEPESDSSYANPNGSFAALIGADRTWYFNLPLYVENQHYLTEALSVLTGFQAVYVHRSFIDNLKSAALGDQSHDDDFRAFNPKLGVAYEWNKTSLAYFNLSRSFQPPSFDQSIGIKEGVNGGRVFHELDAQNAWTVEVGTRGEAGPFSWDLALYRSWVSDELLDQNNNRGQPLGTINAPRTIHQGIEIGLETELFRGLLLKEPETRPPDDKSGPSRRTRDRLVFEQAYTLNDFTFDNSPVYRDNRIAGLPVHSYKAQLLYEHPSGFYFGTNLEWNITKYPVDEANTLFADPYALLGFRLGYKTRKGPQLYFETKNVTDKIYAATVEPIGDARSGDTASFNPGNGRAFYGGVSWIW